MLITNATLADVPALAQIERQCIQCPWSENSLTEAIDNDNYAFIVARDGQTVCGYGAIELVPPEANIQNVAVMPPYRRRGVATSVLSELEKLARAAAVTDVYLEVNEHNQAAIALYLSRGYENAYVRKKYYGDDNAIVMRKKLI